MMTEQNKPIENIRYLFSLAIIKKLWIEGFITEDEMKRIDARNKKSFLAS